MKTVIPEIRMHYVINVSNQGLPRCLMYRRIEVKGHEISSDCIVRLDTRVIECTSG